MNTNKNTMELMNPRKNNQSIGSDNNDNPESDNDDNNESTGYVTRY